MRKVTVVGDANVDIIVPFPTIIDEEKNLAEYHNPVLQGGGTAANTAVALAKLGMDTAFVGTIGQDQYGKFVKEDFASAGIDLTNLVIDPELNTVGVFAFIDHRGERYLWGWPRENQAFKELDKEKISADCLEGSCWLHSSGMPLVYDSSARASITELFKEANKLGIPTSFDLNLRVDDGMLDPEYEAAVLEIIQYTDYLLGSGTEEFAYLGKSKDWLTNAQAFVSDKRTVVVRNGSQGSLALTVDATYSASAVPVEVVDTVGAGDVYNAGFIKGIVTGETLEESLKLGNAVAGYTVSKKGARSCPTIDEVTAFIHSNRN